MEEEQKAQEAYEQYVASLRHLASKLDASGGLSYNAVSARCELIELQASGFAHRCHDLERALEEATRERDEARADLVGLWGWVFGSEPPPPDWKEVMLERGEEILAARQEYSSREWRTAFLRAERTIREFCEELLGPITDAEWHQGTRPELPEAENLAVRAGVEIERLKLERDEARAALEKIVNNWGNLHPKDRQQARAALGWPLVSAGGE
jgi:hypothetical protein